MSLVLVDQGALNRCRKAGCFIRSKLYASQELVTSPDVEAHRDGVKHDIDFNAAFVGLEGAHQNVGMVSHAGRLTT